MRVLVAGATGFVGRALVENLARTHSVHALARTESSALARNVEWHAADLAAPLKSWSLPSSWDVTVYLAQSSGYRDFPAQACDMSAVNVHAVAQLLDESRRRGAGQFLLTSSANVYASSDGRIHERAPLAPSTFYARTKMAAEMLAEPYAVYLAVTIVRMFTVYGPGQRADGLVGSLIDRVVAGRPVQVQGTRGLLVSPVFVDDAIAGLGSLIGRAGSPRHEVFNLGGDVGLGVGELATAIGEVVGKAARFEAVAGGEPGGWVADTAALRSATGWAPVVSLPDGLQATMRTRT